MSRSCGDCVHYEVCYIAKSIRDVYHSIPPHSLRNYEELIKWARSFAEHCMKFKPEKKETA